MTRIKTRRVDLASLLTGSAGPIYLFDSGRRVVGANPALLAWAECSAEELVSQRADYHTPDAAQRPSERGAVVAAGLCPPPDVFAGKRGRHRVSFPLLDGEERSGWVDFTPIMLEGRPGAVLAIVDEVGSASPDQREADQQETIDESAPTELHERLRQFRRAAAVRYSFDRLIGESPQMVRARARASLAAQARENVLIVGPAGSGKEHLAKAIHYGRAGQTSASLVPLSAPDVDLAGFRSAVAPLRGRAAAGDDPALGGHLLLFDVEQLGIDSQVELEEILADGSLRSLVIATAARPLDELAANGLFRSALACALSTLVIELPPLAKRPDDIPLIAQALLESANARGSKQLGGFASDALERLVGYEWPGNVDELARTIAETHDRAAGPLATLADLPDRLRLAADAARRAGAIDDAIELNEFLQQVERELITRALRRAKGNKSRAAKLLGLTRPRLYRRMLQLGLASGE